MGQSKKFDSAPHEKYCEHSQCQLTFVSLNCPSSWAPSAAAAAACSGAVFAVGVSAGRTAGRTSWSGRTSSGSGSAIPDDDWSTIMFEIPAKHLFFSTHYCVLVVGLRDGGGGLARGVPLVLALLHLKTSNDLPLLRLDTFVIIHFYKIYHNYSQYRVLQKGGPYPPKV